VRELDIDCHGRTASAASEAAGYDPSGGVFDIQNRHVCDRDLLQNATLLVVGTVIPECRLAHCAAQKSTTIHENCFDGVANRMQQLAP